MQTAVILGAGQLGRYLGRLLDPARIRLLAWGDNDRHKHDPGGEIPVLAVAQALALAPAVVWIAVTGADRIAALQQQVQEAGCTARVTVAAEWLADLNLRTALLGRLAKRLEAGRVAGAVAELGVYRGEFAVCLSRIFPQRRLYLFDTFTGFSPSDLRTEQALQYSQARAGDFSDTAAELVRARLPYPQQAVIRAGHFPETAAGLQETFALVSLDADLYEPTLAGLEYFYPRLNRGGILLLHDYDSGQFCGVRAALQAYEKRCGPLLRLPLGDCHGSEIIIKD